MLNILNTCCAFNLNYIPASTLKWNFIHKSVSAPSTERKFGFNVFPDDMSRSVERRDQTDPAITWYTTASVTAS